MVQTKRKSKQQQQTNEKSDSKKPPVVAVEDKSSDSDLDESPPQPVSSDSEAEMPQQQSQQPVDNKVSISRLFAPYRTIGLVSSGAPFDLVPHQSSASAMISVPIQDRFQLVQTDKLHPVLVSQSIATAPGNLITHCVTDATLAITVVSHGTKSTTNTSVTLFQRAQPKRTIRMDHATRRSQWRTVTLLHLGRTKLTMTGEKEGKKENAAIIAAILSRQNSTNEEADDDDDDDMQVGDSDDDESSHDDADHNESERQEVDDLNCAGQVIILIATRTDIKIQKRIPFNSMPTFRPTSAMHPSTYLNKIVVAGVSIQKEQSDQTRRPTMILLNIRSSKIIHDFTCLCDLGATVTTLEQSPAVDTIAVGTNSGRVHLVNLRMDKTLFTLKHKSNKKGGGVSITSISFRTDASAMQYGIAPMAVGRSDGNITVWDLTPPDNDDDNNNNSTSRTVLCEMERVHDGGVSKLQYFPQEPLLISNGVASNSIIMHIFDNPDHSARVLRQRKGHLAPPTRIRYLHPGGGILANAADGTDASSCQILSSGGPDRTLRVFSTARSVLDKEYSQGRGLEKKARKFGIDKAELLLPPLTAMALSEARTRDWGDLVTIHKDHAFAYVWSTRRGSQSGPILKQPLWNVSARKDPPPVRTHATSVVMSRCGNFALVGTRGGTIYRYNVQSGLPRGSYPIEATLESSAAGDKKMLMPGDVKRTMRELGKAMEISNRLADLDRKDAEEKERSKRNAKLKSKLASASHQGYAVTGLAVDSLNKTLISIGSDAKLIFWSFATHAPHKKCPYILPAPATRLCHACDSNLAAIALEDFSVILFDCNALSIVRRFGSGASRHLGSITDLTFSPDGRNLFTSSIDGTIRVWDIPTSMCIDWLGFRSPPTSLSVSPTGEFLATTHVGKLGISIWSDRSYYQSVQLDGVKLSEPIQMDEPKPLADAGSADNDKKLQVVEASKEVKKGLTTNLVDPDVPVVPKEKGLITMSGLPASHWKNLFHLELVKERNKPQEPPKKPPSAPFFLQWRPGEAMAAGENESKQETAQEEGEWAAAWSDDDDAGDQVDDDVGTSVDEPLGNQRLSRKRKLSGKDFSTAKSRGFVRYRSNLAKLLLECSKRDLVEDEMRFKGISDYVSGLGPSAIDVELSSLCSGVHDLEEGLPLLKLACQWLEEAMLSCQMFEAVGAYLHRFLYIHASLLAGVRESVRHTSDENNETRAASRDVELLETISNLMETHQMMSDRLNTKMSHSIGLLRHFSRMV